jgi:hypothetical protein
MEHYSHVRQEAKRKAVEGLDNVTIQLRHNWRLGRLKRKEESSQLPEITRETMVGSAGLEPATSCL